jgi:hypothetical protein
MRLALSIFLSLSWLITAGAARAANGDALWDSDGEDLAASSFYAIASDGDGGVYAVWDENPGIRVQRLDDTGAAQWAGAGTLVSSTGTTPAIVADEVSGATVAWEESGGVKVQRLNPSGAVQWTAGGVQVATNGEFPLVVHIPGPGLGDPPGALIAWGEAARIAAVDGTGTVTAPGVDGISLGSSVRLPGYMRMVSDDAGGAIVVWADFAKDIVAQRVNAGLPWGATPTVVSNDSRNEGPLDAKADGQGGTVISWAAIDLVGSTAQLRVQQINASGTSGWTTNGVVVVDSTVVGGPGASWVFFEFASAVASDGAGGAIVAWNDWRNDPPVGNDDVFAQRVDSTSAIRWTANGVLLPPFIQGATAPGSQRDIRAVSDGNGGAVVTYMDLGGNSWDISANRLDAYGNKLFSIYVFSDFNQDDAIQKWPEVVFDGSGPTTPGAIIGWSDARSGKDTLAQKIEISGPGNDDSGSAYAVGAGSYLDTLFGASRDGDSSCGSGGETDVWFVFTPPSAGTLEVDTCGTNDLGGVDAGIDTVLSLHSAEPGTTGNELACNDDWTGGGLPVSECAPDDTGAGRDSATSLAVTTAPVWIRVAHFPNSTPGDYELNVRFVPEPGGLVLLVTGIGWLAIISRRSRARG